MANQFRSLKTSMLNTTGNWPTGSDNDLHLNVGIPTPTEIVFTASVGGDSPNLKSDYAPEQGSFQIRFRGTPAIGAAFDITTSVLAYNVSATDFLNDINAAFLASYGNPADYGTTGLLTFFSSVTGSNMGTGLTVNYRYNSMGVGIVWTPAATNISYIPGSGNPLMYNSYTPNTLTLSNGSINNYNNINIEGLNRPAGYYPALCSLVIAEDNTNNYITVIGCKRDFILNGKIIGSLGITNAGTYNTTGTLPSTLFDGTGISSLSYILSQATGGSGGAGGRSSTTGTEGAAGATSNGWGGGGGGGGGQTNGGGTGGTNHGSGGNGAGTLGAAGGTTTSTPTTATTAGSNASSTVCGAGGRGGSGGGGGGGTGTGSTYGHGGGGGSGGWKGRHRAGLFIKCLGNVSGSGSIEMYGENGASGTNGGNGTKGASSGSAGGGGTGGGGAGGNSGAFWMFYKNNSSSITVIQNGITYGKAGNRGSINGSGTSGGTSGSLGSAGTAGNEASVVIQALS